MMNLFSWLRNMFRGSHTPEITPSNVADLVLAVERETGVNLTSSSSNASVAMRRAMVNVILDRTGWTATEMATDLRESGITGHGWSRRSLSWYKTTAEWITSNEPGGSAEFSRQYSMVSVIVNSNL